MKIVCISDTHCSLKEYIDGNLMPDGDVLVHTGDLTYLGKLSEMSRELGYLGKLKSKYKHIIYIAGNHDWLAELNSPLTRELCNENGITYLEDEEFIIDGIKFYGSPQTPEFCNWAFNQTRGDEITAFWDRIPEDTQVLLTHGPPLQILDYCDNGHVGCYDLRAAVHRIKPKLHVFGHIHEGYGTYDTPETKFVNASLMNGNYQPVNMPVVVVI